MTAMISVGHIYSKVASKVVEGAQSKPKIIEFDISNIRFL